MTEPRALRANYWWRFEITYWKSSLLYAMIKTLSTQIRRRTNLPSILQWNKELSETKLLKPQLNKALLSLSNQALGACFKTIKSLFKKINMIGLSKIHKTSWLRHKNRLLMIPIKKGVIDVNFLKIPTMRNSKSENLMYYRSLDNKAENLKEVQAWVMLKLFDYKSCLPSRWYLILNAHLFYMTFIVGVERRKTYVWFLIIKSLIFTAHSFLPSWIN